MKLVSSYTNLLLATLIAITSFCTIVYQYTSPEHLYWDENYHIASAQKYLNRVFFMEPHPPLGKLLIALGEALVDANDNDSSFTASDHGKELPSHFSFAGYRLFPVLLTALTAPLFFLFVLRLTNHPFLACISALALALDNAFVVHGRAAMLDGIQLFFIVCTLTGIISIYRRLQHTTSLRILPYTTGITLGSALATKVTSLIIVPFLGIIVIQLWNRRAALLVIFTQIILPALATYLVSWQVHIALGQKIEPALPNQGFYQASEESKQRILGGDAASAQAFIPLVRDHLRFFSHYQRGVPKLNLCNLTENGSPPMLWPLGGRTINYRWDKKDGKTSYTYLVANPAVLAFGLLGLITSAAFFITSLLGRCTMHREWRVFAGTLLFMWIGYMAIMVSLDRVMYLYHYFIPLTFSLALTALTLPQIQLPKVRFLPPSYVFYALLGIAIFFGFRTYAPLTYGYPISDSHIKNLALLDMWDLRCIDCDLSNHVARPVCNPKEKRFPRVTIDSLSATDSYQEWGDPIQGLSVDKKEVIVRDLKYDTAIGTHAASTLRFPVNKRFTSLSGKAAIPDYVKTKSGTPASIIFEVWIDGVQIWSSRTLSTKDQLQEFTLPILGGNVLELRTTDAGDGNNNDHAVWLDLHLK